jgi:two-component system chemotaxis response regulator CheY
LYVWRAGRDKPVLVHDSGGPVGDLQRAARQRRARSLEMSKAMVVDDSKAVRMILSRILRQLGYEVCEASDGDEALARLAGGESVSLVLVDWNMPKLDGLGFVRCLRSDPAKSAVKVMMVTTETEMDQMVTALEAGANEYVMKPFTAEIISDKLRIMEAL